MSVIKLEKITHVYNQGLPTEKIAISNIDLEVEKGQTVGIIGHTGSGKSTLIQHLNALIEPTSGKVFINGKDIWENPKKVRPVRFQVGMVFQYPEYQLFEETVFKDIAFGPKNMKLGEEEIKERVMEAAKYAGVDPDWFHKSPFELSGGQKRRVAIAGVLAMRPEILVLDEPAAGLDPKGKDSIMKFIETYKREMDATVVFISHSMDDIAAYTDHVLVLNQGEVEAFGTTKEIFSHADELQMSGLDIPQVSQIVMGLREKGYEIDKGLLTLDEVASAIERLYKGGEKTC